MKEGLGQAKSSEHIESLRLLEYNTYLLFSGENHDLWTVEKNSSLSKASPRMFFPWSTNHDVPQKTVNKYIMTTILVVTPRPHTHSSYHPDL